MEDWLSTETKTKYTNAYQCAKNLGMCVILDEKWNEKCASANFTYKC
jgi:hypothetical protein